MTRPRQKKSGAGSARRPATCVGAVLIVAFLAASLAPCPPRVRAEAAHADRAQEGHAQSSAAFLTAQCPCGCEEHLPIVGNSARLGVALLSVAPDLAPRPVAGLDVFAAPLFGASFATPIDHIPLLA